MKQPQINECEAYTRSLRNLAAEAALTVRGVWDMPLPIQEALEAARDGLEAINRWDSFAQMLIALMISPDHFTTTQKIAIGSAFHALHDSMFRAGHDPSLPKDIQVRAYERDFGHPISSCATAIRLALEVANAEDQPRLNELAALFTTITGVQSPSLADGFA